jgi:1-acyl-sn-glycerol-3-phosphate acyltransferase
VQNGHPEAAKPKPAKPVTPPREREKNAFMGDEVVGESLIFKFAYFIFYCFARVFNHYDLDVPAYVYERKGKGALIVSVHTTHNWDIFTAVTGLYKRYGVVVRSLIFREVRVFAPWTQYLGCVAGYRDVAIELLKEGHFVGCIPGGAEEAIRGHENAYNLKWPKKRKGFVHVAKKAGVPIIPCITKNGEEMRWNPIFWLGNLLCLGKIFSRITNAQIPYLSEGIKLIGLIIWFTLCWFTLPVPVKARLVFGEPIYVGEHDDPDEIARQTQAALQALLDRNHPGGKSYRRGLIERWNAFKEAQKSSHQD